MVNEKGNTGATGSPRNETSTDNIARHLLMSDYTRNFSALERLHPEMFREFRNNIKDAVVVDMGGGDAKFIQTIAQEDGAQKYINVDINHRHQQQQDDEGVLHIKQDMYEFLLESAKYIDEKAKKVFVFSGLDDASLYTGDAIEDSEYEYESELIFVLNQVMNEGDLAVFFHAEKFLNEIKEFEWMYLIQEVQAGTGTFAIVKKMS